MGAKKSLGQHFLRSEKALKSIIHAGELKDGDIALEIGPGEGVLTEKLLGARCKVLAVEKDDKLYELLKEKFQKEIKSEQLKLIHDDILNLELTNLPTYKLISNIPYNITGAILEKFLSGESQPKLMVLLVQKEVAERIIGNRGSKASTKESILSISVKAYGVPHYIETVRAGSFVPVPKVDSAIIKIDHISKEFFKDFGEKEFFKLLRASFQSKRKKLLSNLSVILPKTEVHNAFKKLNLDENTRAEDISPEIWHKLAQNLCRK